jgi:alkylation response protein AidB-like acyl-CoA dehydrogenase
MVSGEWAGTMCLTEAHSGSDLGILRTKAEPLGDGSYAITGTKIFISAGEHDLTGQHRPPRAGAPAGRAPGHQGHQPVRRAEVLPDATTASLGAANGVKCGSIEHKMGIHASPTCVMHFNDSKGWLLGKANAGLSCMFTMMNHARLGVGLQGSRPVGARLAGVDRLRQRPAAGPLAHRRQDARQARRPDHRPPGRAPHAAHAEGVRRGRSRAVLPDGPRDRQRAP